jgi:solute carrier family 50 (sugar transporter)
MVAIPGIASAFSQLPAPILSSMQLIDLCCQLAPAASIAVFLAPMPTIQNVIRDRSVGTLPLLPYSSMVASATLWTTYGVLKNEPSIWSANGVGLLLGTYYFYNFLQFAPKAAPTLPGSQEQHVKAVIAVTVATLITAASPLPPSFIGSVGVLLCMFMFGSPLAALKTVMQTKSAKAIPLPFAVASTLNCFLWSVAGLFKMKDINVYFPNLVGLAFSLGQVALKVKYGDGSKRQLDGGELPI